MASTPVDLYSEGEENASRGLFQLLVSPSVVAPLGQKNVPTAAPRVQKGPSRTLRSEGEAGGLHANHRKKGREADH